MARQNNWAMMSESSEQWRNAVLQRHLAGARSSVQPELFVVLGNDANWSLLAAGALSGIMGTSTVRWVLDEVCRLHPEYCDLAWRDPSHLLQHVVPEAQAALTAGVLETARRRCSGILILPAGSADADLETLRLANRQGQRLICVVDQRLDGAPRSPGYGWAVHAGAICHDDPRLHLRRIRSSTLPIVWWPCGEAPEEPSYNEPAAEAVQSAPVQVPSPSAPPRSSAMQPEAALSPEAERSHVARRRQWIERISRNTSS